MKELLELFDFKDLLSIKKDVNYYIARYHCVVYVSGDRVYFGKHCSDDLSFLPKYKFKESNNSLINIDKEIYS